ncbi:AAA family ATPase [Pseudofulvibacter geojedonensis]|uniref:ATP/GTP-binding protein n=1 Tax=Pseudofulvibacter geojedonensis TaxID=1123758 RepID=A0ABW3I1N3_9FLAO
MIIDFSVKNFRSLKEESFFTMLADSSSSKLDNTFLVELKDGKEIRLLKTAVVYGANGSGKSNFIKSLYALKWLVTNSMDFKVEDDIDCYEPFELDVNTKDESVFYSITFILKKIKYSYQVCIKDNYVESEILDYYPKGAPANLFKRFVDKKNEKDDFVEVSFGKNLLDKRISKKVFDNQLYISKFGSDTPHKQLTEVYKYFKDIEVWNALDSRDVNKLSREISKKIANPINEKFNNRLSKLIRIADTKIERLSAKELKKKDFKLPDEIPDSIKDRFYEDNKLRTFAIHKMYDDKREVGLTEFDLNRKESRGTKVLFALGGIILEALENGGIVVFDELDNSLHPKLCKFLIRLFNNSISNPNNAQLIFATHEVTLLDKDVFRKDQIWFTEKDKYGETELFSARDVEGLRDNTNFELWYRTGKFGGNPKIKEVEFIFE